MTVMMIVNKFFFVELLRNTTMERRPRIVYGEHPGLDPRVNLYNNMTSVPRIRRNNPVTNMTPAATPMETMFFGANNVAHLQKQISVQCNTTLDIASMNVAMTKVWAQRHHLGAFSSTPEWVDMLNRKVVANVVRDLSRQHTYKKHYLEHFALKAGKALPRPTQRVRGGKGSLYGDNF